jgi:hypothetical protein
MVLILGTLKQLSLLSLSKIVFMMPEMKRANQNLNIVALSLLHFIFSIDYGTP